MRRLIWISNVTDPPEATFEPLGALRPAPELIFFADATPELMERRAPQAILIDGRYDPDAAGGLSRKLSQGFDVPIMIVVDPDKASHLDPTSGFTDFITTDAGEVELVTRLTKMTRGPGAEEGAVIRRGPISINKERFEVRVEDAVLDLTFKEFELLEHLARRPGKVCSRSQLLSEVWGYDFFGGTRTVDVHVRRLRAKLGPHSHHIETVRNVGYRFAG